MSQLKFLLLFLVFAHFSLAQTTKPIAPSEQYLQHLKAAKSHGIKLIQSKSELDKLVSKGKLVSIKKRGYGWRVANLSHSHAYLVPKGRSVVADIAREFVRQTGQNFFILTSLTRTSEDQNSLRKINVNASVFDSSHNFGAAFDISYVRFNHRLEENPKLEKKLEEVLRTFERQGRIYFVKEKKMKCFHVIVR